MTPARKTASLICAAAALAAAAGAVIARRGQSSAASAAVGKSQTEAAGALDAAQKALEGLERGLEIEVKGAASITQLKAALADGVDAVTILDLFESEDWWAPFRARGAALVTAGRTLAARMDKGDKRMPLPNVAMLERAQTAGVASGVLLGDSVLVVAVVPVGTARRGDSTYLVLAMPLEAQALQKATGVPVMLSDGQRPVSVAGSASQQSALSRLVGKEAEGRAQDPESMWFALATPVGPKLWLWVLHPTAVAASSGAVPVLFAVVAILLGVGAFVLRRGGRGADDRAAAAAGGSGIGVPSSLPGLAPKTAREIKHRGTQPYETPGDMGHRPTEIAKSGSSPVSSAMPAWSAGIAGRAAELAADPYPERARVETGTSTFGRYRLLQRLGEGGMAELYTAVLHGAEGFRRVYVVKRLRPEVARNRAAVEQFIDEAKLGSTLVHSNIVPVFDFGKVGDEYFLAQEYIIGRDLGKVLQRHMDLTGRPLGERLVLYIVHEVLEALAYAHNRTDAAGNPIGLVHRDISPGNVMITARGEVKLFDFGIVKGEGRVSKTDVGVVKGNVSFMSPEQARGHAVDARSDLFSLGLVLYYGLTGEQLYPGQSTFDQLMRAATGPKTEQLKALADLPLASSAVVMRALSVDPGLRYQTAADFAASVAPHISGGKAEAAALMQQLFGEEFKRESAT
jgi:protein kinase-like protein